MSVIATVIVNAEKTPINIIRRDTGCACISRLRSNTPHAYEVMISHPKHGPLLSLEEALACIRRIPQDAILDIRCHIPLTDQEAQAAGIIFYEKRGKSFSVPITIPAAWLRPEFGMLNWQGKREPSYLLHIKAKNIDALKGILRLWPKAYSRKMSHL